MSDKRSVVIPAASQVLVHAPNLARHGSKPSRVFQSHPEIEAEFIQSLRSFEDAMAYPPNQAYLGTFHPRELPPRPLARVRHEGSARFTEDGEIMPEEEFLGLMAAVDEFGLLSLAPDVAERAAKALTDHPVAGKLSLTHLLEPASSDWVEGGDAGSLSLYLGPDEVAGSVTSAHPDDEALAAPVLLENLAVKASGVLALKHLIVDQGIDPESIEYVISCSEEAVGDRYQRGGGNLAKGIAAMAGLTQASGADLKNFCAAPLPAIVIAGALVASGVFQRVAVVAGGSLPKLGMKFQGQLKHGLPILEDVLGGCALLVEADDGKSPKIRLDAVGRHTVAAGGSNPQIMEALAVGALSKVGIKMLDVDDYATELHDPDVTEPQGSGNVPERNYKMIASLAVRKGEMGRDKIEEFVAQRGMPGFAPTQGHLASALCYLPHAVRRLTTGDAQRVHMIAKGSLFLGRMSQLSDGMSVLLERNTL
jgi:hypothetical protein